jgi:hypothetical protein
LDQLLKPLNAFISSVRIYGSGIVTETSDLTYVMAVLFIVVFALNLLPAFAAPTWTTMSFIGLGIPNIDVVLLALVAATAATCGRVLMAKFSRALVRQRLLTEQAHAMSMRLELRVAGQ